MEDRYLLEEQIENENIGASQINLELIRGYKTFYNIKVKRFLDFFIAVVIFICLLPIYILISVAIIVEDGFPILYCAERGGFHGRPFRIYKFRSMIKDADKVGGGTTALNDKRITKVGSIIRKFKLDEFPNLLNVIKGEMSFIGPRPELLVYTNKYIGSEKTIFEVRPGITDYSSIEFINLDELVGSRNADEMYERYILPKKNKLRVKYAANVSFITDVKLFILTIYKVIEKIYSFVVNNKHH